MEVCVCEGRGVTLTKLEAVDMRVGVADVVTHSHPTRRTPEQQLVASKLILSSAQPQSRYSLDVYSPPPQ